MYRRMTGLLALLVFMMMMLLAPLYAGADQLGLGGAWVDGHSDSGDYGINNKGSQSWGVHLNYDKDLGWKKVYDNQMGFGIDPSMQLFYLHWSKTLNKKKEVCTEGDCERYDTTCTTLNGYDCQEEECHTEKSYSTQNVDSLIAAVGPKAWVGFGRFQVYGLAGMGYALQDGAQDDAAGVLQVGISAQITKNFGLSLDHSEVYVNPFGSYDRFDVTALNAVLFF